jgi:hypothetical protein
MIDDLLVRNELEALTAPPRRTPDWDDVVRRAQPALRQRPVVLGLAATLAVVVCVAATAAVTGGFDRWLRGQPGKPAPSEEQQRFEAANGRSWASFPTTTKLRELIRTEVGGKKYVLYGWRSGNSLCLRLDGLDFSEHSSGCAPASLVARTSSPIVPVVGNWIFSARSVRPFALTSFGIAADGVSRVDVEADDGVRRAVVGGNAYLFVEPEPNSGSQAVRVVARGSTGRTTIVPLASTNAFFGLQARLTRPAKGPRNVEATIARPTIGWLVRHEKRGVSVDAIKLTPNQRHLVAGMGYRLVKPDPLSDVVVGLAGDLAITVLRGTDGVNVTARTKLRDAFKRGPLDLLISGGGSEYFAVTGIAADGVARVKVFTADSQIQVAALRDNVFLAQVARTQLPIRVAAYDRRGRVVGIATPPLGTFRVPISAESPLRSVMVAKGANGTVATLRVGRNVRGFRCWRVEFSTGRAAHECVTPVHGPHLWVDRVQQSGRDIFVIGHVDDLVERVRLRFEKSYGISVRPVAGFFVLAIPGDHLDTQQQKAYVVGFDGRRPNRQGIFYRLR